MTTRLLPAALPFSQLALVRALQRGERPEPVLDLCQPSFDHGAHNFLSRLVARRGFIERHAPVCVDDDAGGRVLVVNRALRERAHSFAAREPPTRAVIDGVAAARCAGQRAQNVAPIFATSGDEDGVARRGPKSSLQGRMPGGKSARRTLAMHPHVAYLRVLLVLHEVVADLVEQLKL